jgi:hypothetical protein
MPALCSFDRIAGYDNRPVRYAMRLKRIFRFILWPIQAILLLVCLTAIFFWIWTYHTGWREESIYIWEKPGEKNFRYIYFATESGAVWFGVDRIHFNRCDLGGAGQSMEIGPTINGISTPFRGGLIAPWTLSHGKLSARGRLAWWRDGDQGSWGEYHNWAVASPFWLIVLASGLMPASGLVIAIKRKRELRRRSRVGLCPKCGYDLRATPRRCPECGWEVEP